MSKICPLGNILAKLSVIFFISRIFYYLCYQTPEKVYFLCNYVILAMSLLMNLNAFIYLIPIFVVEYYHCN